VSKEHRRVLEMDRTEMSKPASRVTGTRAKWQIATVCQNGAGFIAALSLFLTGCNSPTPAPPPKVTQQTSTNSYRPHQVILSPKRVEKPAPPPAPRPEPPAQSKAQPVPPRNMAADTAKPVATPAAPAVVQAAQPKETTRILSATAPAPKATESKTVAPAASAVEEGTTPIDPPQHTRPKRAGSKIFVWLGSTVFLLGLVAFAYPPLRMRMVDAAANVGLLAAGLKTKFSSKRDDGEESTVFMTGKSRVTDKILLKAALESTMPKLEKPLELPPQKPEKALDPPPSPPHKSEKVEKAVASTPEEPVKASGSPTQKSEKAVESSPQKSEKKVELPPLPKTSQGASFLKPDSSVPPAPPAKTAKPAETVEPKPQGTPKTARRASKVEV